MHRRNFLKFTGTAVLVAALPMKALAASRARKQERVRLQEPEPDWAHGTIHVRLYTSAGEIRGAGYVPQLVVFGMAVSVDALPTIGNENQIDFPQALEDWGDGEEIRYFSLCDWKRRPLFFGRVKQARPVLCGDVARFPPGTIEADMKGLTDLACEETYRVFFDESH